MHGTLAIAATVLVASATAADWTPCVTDTSRHFRGFAEIRDSYYAGHGFRDKLNFFQITAKIGREEGPEIIDSLMSMSELCVPPFSSTIHC